MLSNVAAGLYVCIHKTSNHGDRVGLLKNGGKECFVAQHIWWRSKRRALPPGWKFFCTFRWIYNSFVANVYRRRSFSIRTHPLFYMAKAWFCVLVSSSGTTQMSLPKSSRDVEHGAVNTSEERRNSIQLIVWNVGLVLEVQPQTVWIYRGIYYITYICTSGISADPDLSIYWGFFSLKKRNDKKKEAKKGGGGGGRGGDGGNKKEEIDWALKNREAFRRKCWKEKIRNWNREITFLRAWSYWGRRATRG